MLDPLGELRTCEDDFARLPVIPDRTVVCTGVWGQDLFARKIKSIIGEQNLVLSTYGLTDAGIGLIFDTQKDAAVFRLFYSGDTLVDIQELQLGTAVSH